MARGALSKGEVPEPAVARLSYYLRHLERPSPKHLATISSRELGQAVGCTAAQVRKDLGYFGQFGRPGVGYPVEQLAETLRRILGTHRLWEIALVGAGNLGQAIMAYGGFQKRGFHVACAFDADERVVGRRVGGVTIQRVDEFERTIHKRGIRMGTIAVGAARAQQVADMMVAAGIRGILNFAPIELHLSDEVVLYTVDLAVALERIAYHMSHPVPKAKRAVTSGGASRAPSTPATRRA